jgi:hypothetical protein
MAAQQFIVAFASTEYSKYAIWMLEDVLKSLSFKLKAVWVWLHNVGLLDLKLMTMIPSDNNLVMVSKSITQYVFVLLDLSPSSLQC